MESHTYSNHLVQLDQANSVVLQYVSLQPLAATTEEMPGPYGRGTSSVASFVVAMNRVDVVELVVDLDVDLVDVDLAVSLCDGPRSV